MASISATQPVTGLVETLRTELINSARLDKATERKNLLNFTQELDRLTDTRVDERTRIRELNELLQSEGQRPLEATGSVPLSTAAPLANSRPAAGFNSASVSATGISSSLFSTLIQQPQLTDVTESALLRLLSVNPSLESTTAAESPADTETELVDSAVEIADVLSNSIADGISAVETQIANRPLAVPITAPQALPLSLATASSAAVQPAVGLGQQGSPSAGSNQDALLAKYGIGQRGAGVRAVPPNNQRNRRSTELEVEPFE